MVKLRKKKLSNGYQHLYLDIHANGVRKKEYLKLYLTGAKEDKEILRKADEIRIKTEYELINDTYFTNMSMKKSFYEFYDKFSNTFKSKNEKDGLVRHLKKIRSEITFEEINPAFWHELKEYFIQIGYANYTIYIAWKKLNAIINHAIKLEYIPKNNLSRVSEKRPQTYREYLLLEELQVLANTPCRKDNIKNAFLFACYTGLRLGDLKSLTYDNIKNNQVEIRQKKTQNFVYIPISQHAYRYLSLDKPHKPEDKIFTGLSKGGTMHTAIKEWVAAAGIKKKIMFHTSRHTFATLSLTYGVEIETVSELLGHRDLRATKIYAKIISKKKEEAVNKLPLF